MKFRQLKPLAGHPKMYFSLLYTLHFVFTTGRGMMPSNSPAGGFGRGERPNGATPPFLSNTPVRQRLVCNKFILMICHMIRLVI